MTLAELKRNAATGKMSLELFEWYNEIDEGIPERLRGIRKVVKVNSVALILLNENGRTSELRLNSAKLMEYNGEYLTIYEVGERDLTEEEKNILAEWERIQEDYLIKNPYSETYWKRKEYFKNCSCPWLAGHETIRGKRYTYNGKIRDNQVRGNAILKYKVYFN